MEKFSFRNEPLVTRPLEYVADQIVKHLLEKGPENDEFRACLNEWLNRRNEFIDYIQHAPSRQKGMDEMNLDLGRIYARAGYYLEAMENYYQVYRVASQYVLREEARAELERLLSQFEGGELELMQAALAKVRKEFDAYLN